MKKDIHPAYNFVVFEDLNSGTRFLTRSCVTPKEETQWEDGKTYGLFKVEISALSHPFYTGKRLLLNTSGKVDKFMKKYNIKKK